MLLQKLNFNYLHTTNYYEMSYDIMKIFCTIYLYGKEEYTKENPKKIDEEIEAISEYECKKQLFNKWRKKGWWVYSIQDGDKSIV